MTLKSFIDCHKQELQETIGKAISYVPRSASCNCYKKGTDHYHDMPKVSVSEIREWILNDEGLYQWARSEGVRI